MATISISLITISLMPILLFSLQALAQGPAAAPAGPVNLTGILDKNGQFKTFIGLLNTTQIGNQVENQLNSSTDGMTVFAPNDNAFNNLKPGTLNGLNTQQQIQLVLYHILPKFYTLSSLLLVSNPARTLATGQDGGVFGLNFTGQGNQVNVTTGVVETPINNALRSDFPLAVYQVDQVLLPEELFGVKPPTAAPAGPRNSSSSGSNTTAAASEPAPNGAGGRNGALGMAVGLELKFAFNSMQGCQVDHVHFLQVIEKQ